MAFWLQNSNLIEQRKPRKKHRLSKKDSIKISTMQEKLALNLKPHLRFGNRMSSATPENTLPRAPNCCNTKLMVNIPVNTIDLWDISQVMKSKTSQKLRRSMSRGVKSSLAQSRSDSADSNYASDFSVNTGGFNLTNQNEISEEEFLRIQEEGMGLIKSMGDTISQLEFKKLFNWIKSYCKLKLLMSSE